MATSGNFADLQNKPTTIAGYGITDAYTKTEIDNKVSSVYKYKGSVATYANLPTSGQVVGAVYNVEENGANYAWDGTTWDKLGETIDLSPYLLQTDATLAETNPALTASSGICTWTISNTLNNADVICSVREVATGEEVFASVTYSSSNIVIKINSASNIAAGTYKAVIIGQKVS